MVAPSGAPAWVIALPPAEQVAWFTEHPEVVMRLSEWAEFHGQSTQHVGLCCSSCISDRDEGYGDLDPDCCCIALRHEGRDRGDDGVAVAITGQA